MFDRFTTPASPARKSDFRKTLIAGFRPNSGASAVNTIFGTTALTAAAEGTGWRSVDSAASRDGSTYAERIDVLRFTDSATRTLIYASLGAMVLIDKAGGQDSGGTEVLAEMPILAADDFALLGEVDGPEVLPALFDDNLPLRLNESDQFELGRQMDACGHPLVVAVAWASADARWMNRSGRCPPQQRSPALNGRSVTTSGSMAA